MRHRRQLAGPLGALFLLFWAPMSGAQLETVPPDPPAALRLTAAFLGFGSACVGSFRITVENVGATDTFVHVGTLLGGGRRQIPDALSGRIRANGTEREFSWRPYFVGGTLHDALVPLGAGAAYSVRVSTDSLVTSTDGGRIERYAADPGASTWAFVLRSQPARPSEETLGIVRPPLWTGELRAEDVVVPGCLAGPGG